MRHHAMTFALRTLNSISPRGLSRLPADYEVGSDLDEADAWLVRSADLHQMAVPESVMAVARAGVGTNNIPVTELSERGVVVFFTPGANANAVKELVIAGMLLAARNIIPALQFERNLSGDDNAISQAVESGKKQFVGWELPGRTLGVIGLGAIGVEVANAANALGMRVLGYDPAITIRHAWQLASDVDRAGSLEEVFKKADVITVHVPLLDSTRNLVSAERIAMMKHRAVLMNFARGGIVDEGAVLAALEANELRSYVCDFPSQALHDHPKVISLPHLGASTSEAEENCAIMAADALRDFLDNGNITNSVNFPNASMSRDEGTHRIVIANRNVPNMVAMMSTLIGEAQLNITNLLNKSRGDLAWTMIDVEGEVPETLREQIFGIDGVLSARLIH